MQLGKYSLGTGDRFAHQGVAQLSAILKARQELGVAITPVWNKSNREHNIVHSEPADARRAADAAVKSLAYNGLYFVDADHINLGTVDRFIEPSDFFTLDVADFIGKPAPDADIEAFVAAHRAMIGTIAIPGIEDPFVVDEAYLRSVARKFLLATQEAARIFRHIAEKKGAGNFITEVSMDEVDEAQTPLDLLFILKSLADLRVPVQTIAPKFTGRFNKGVDYVGDVARFAREFEADLLVIDYAVDHFGLPPALKLSVHSGSDKFSIYPVMGRLIRKYNKGLHVKTAGTSWIEEIIGLALAGDDGLALAREVYAEAYARQDELCAPYAAVIDIDHAALPTPDVVADWSGEAFAAALQHEPGNPLFNPGARQLIHVGYKVAAEMGPRYLAALERHRDVIARCVTGNLYDRHLRRLFAVE
ncbi:tagaturonate epimerase family protein [Propionivibrio dicarboxylicus]|uniref:Tagaturonate/fructuronate epimerase n=1 Tax=Propionivibrio dicarboxylicus TaxID=83767 RepID=A0A1G8E3D8_9RHOO|nr:tagaturonate epimerase family protein [Propionivibrio dicarboxylicus]SDH64417.1 tagaturonate epimerase [Propionivibrio dicarboxylicus]